MFGRPCLSHGRMMKAIFSLVTLVVVFVSARGLPRLDHHQATQLLDKKLSPGISNQIGCCPTIDRVSSMISAKGCEVTVKVDIKIITGKDSSPLTNCTADDHRFKWTVDWGDGKVDIGQQWSIGGYGINHALDCTKSTSYGVSASYCSNPDDNVRHQCCDSIFRRVTVPTP